MTKVIATHPRAVVLMLVAAGLLLGLVAGNAVFSPRASADGHVSGVESVVADDAIVNHQLGARSSREQVRIWGSGFAAGQEVILLINDGPGTPSDITNYVTNTSDTNTLVANEQGAWTTVWTLGRFTRQRSGIGPGDGDVERMRTLSVVDPGTLEVITSTPLAFCRLSDRVGIAEDVAEMESELALLQADRDQGLGTKPVNVSDAAWALATAFYPAFEAQLDAQIAEATAELEAKKAGLSVPSHCPA
ncbi:MAG: hypothetical protein OXL97_11850 [Chloroflexota bacterium]|nr:hypothetical protein [Chloroflexota bacterium]MDE2885169.1 hypothetical protein [Chloroflexota bacterium]